MASTTTETTLTAEVGSATSFHAFCVFDFGLGYQQFSTGTSNGMHLLGTSMYMGILAQVEPLEASSPWLPSKVGVNTMAPITGSVPDLNPGISMQPITIRLRLDAGCICCSKDNRRKLFLYRIHPLCQSSSSISSTQWSIQFSATVLQNVQKLEGKLIFKRWGMSCTKTANGLTGPRDGLQDTKGE
ncbi:hypothetical protein U9M48_035511 [Paspalum notatum var. saurae]|uniref:Uncharacterized protein n=1 Tax=Paspalum notatum var. saurae TaxID=547442 RepID=A0AAQ3XA23_PASNO